MPCLVLRLPTPKRKAKEKGSRETDCSHIAGWRVLWGCCFGDRERASLTAPRFWTIRSVLNRICFETPLVVGHPPDRGREADNFGQVRPGGQNQDQEEIIGMQLSPSPVSQDANLKQFHPIALTTSHEWLHRRK